MNHTDMLALSRKAAALIDLRGFEPFREEVECNGLSAMISYTPEYRDDIGGSRGGLDEHVPVPVSGYVDVEFACDADGAESEVLRTYLKNMLN